MANVVAQARAGELALDRMAKANYRLQQSQAAASAKADPFNMQNIIALQQRTAGQTGSLYQQTSSQLSDRPKQQPVDPIPDSAITKSKGLLDTINKLSFSIFVLSFGTQQLGEIFLRVFVQAGEKIEALKFRMEGLTKSQDTFRGIFKVAQDLGVGIDAVAGSFNRFAIANTAMGLTNDKLIEMTRNIGILGLVGGGTAQEVASGMQQLGQSLASGVLQGDELRSIMENMPFLALKLAEQLKVGVGELKGMGAAGQLTSARVSEAFLKMTQELNRLLEDVPVTTERGLARVGNEWAILVNNMLQVIGVDTVGQWFTDIAERIKRFSDYVAENRVVIAGWIAGIASATAALIKLFLAFQVLRTAAVISVGIVAFTTSLNAARVAATSSASANMIYGMSLAGTGRAATTATAASGLYFATLTRGAKVFGLVATAAFPIVSIIAALGVAFMSYRKAQDEATQSASDAVEKFKELDAVQLAAMNRREATKAATESENKVRTGIDALVENAKKIEEAQAAVRDLTKELDRAQAAPSWQTTFTGGTTELFLGELTQWEAKLDALKKKQYDLNDAVGASKVATDGYTSQVIRLSSGFDAQVAAIDRMSKSYKEMKKTLEELPASNRVLEQTLALIDKYGIDEGKRRGARQAILNSYTDIVRDQMKDAKKDDPKQLVDIRNAEISKAQEALKLQLRELDLQEKMNDATSTGYRDYANRVSTVIGLNEKQKDGLRSILPVIEEMSKRYSVAKELVTAIAVRESGGDNFSMGAVSPRRTVNGAPSGGVAGTMQVTRDTAAAVAKKYGLPYTVDEMRTQLRPQMEVAVAYLNQLMAKYNGDVEKAAQAYNGFGPSRDKNYGVKVAQMTNQLSMLGSGGMASMINKQREAAQKSQETVIAGTRDLLATSTDYYARVAAMEQQRALELQKIKDTEGLSDEARSVASLAADARYYAAKRDLEQQTLSYSLETAQIERDGRATATTESERLAQEEADIRTAADLRIAEERRKAGLGLITPADEARRVNAELGVMQKNVDDLKRTNLERWTVSASQAFGSFFGALATGGEAFKDTLKTLVSALRDLMVQMLIITPIANAMKNAMNYVGTSTGSGGSGFSWGGLVSAVAGGAVSGALGGAAGGAGGGVVSGAAGGMTQDMLFANGGAFRSSLMPGLYSQPTYFPMSGWGTHRFAAGVGLLGEAGPEAVLPLRRGANGTLGVEAGGGRASSVVNNVYNSVSADIRTRQNDTGGVDVYVTPKQLSQIESHLASQTVNGRGPLSAAQQNVWGARRVGS
jgi:tape measure domain-containing protein